MSRCRELSELSKLSDMEFILKLDKDKQRLDEFQFETIKQLEREYQTLMTNLNEIKFRLTKLRARKWLRKLGQN